MKLFRLSITQRLWLGLGLLLALFAAADLVSLRATQVLDDTLSRLVRDGETRTGAAYEMNVHLDAIARAVNDYAQNPEPQQRERVKVARMKFERGLANYKAVASEQQSRSLAAQLANAYARYRRQADELMRFTDAQAERIVAFEAHRRDANRLVEQMPQPVWAARTAPPLQKRIAAQALVDALGRGTPALDLSSDDFEQRIDAANRAFAAALDRYQSVVDTKPERDWALALDQWHREGSEQVAAILAAEGALERSASRLSTLRRKLDDVIDSSVQPAAKAELKAAMDKASGTAHQANVLITRGLLLALVLGVLVALAIGRAVKAPLRALVASSKRLAAGELSHRVPATGSDELSKLTAAFNEMAGKLQATTVSRTYMESVVNSMGEALLVISDGIIKTANAGATRLLGYPPGELTGKPLASIFPEQDVDWNKLPSRFTVDLIARDGAFIPVSVSAVPMPARAEFGEAMVCIARDLRDRIAAEQHERQAAVVFENTAEGIVLTAADRTVVMVNPAFTEITGYDLEEVQGKPSGLLWSDRHDSAFSAAVWAAVEQHGQWQGEIWMRRKDGELRPVWKNISVVHNAVGGIVNHIWVFSDITAIKNAEERLNYLAYHDPLTDLPNRLLLADRLRTALNRAERSGSSLAVLCLDLDNFKHVNDTMGHEQGDRLLRAMATRLRACVRDEDSVARLGGDEFVIMLEEVSDPAQAARVAEKVLAAVSEPVQLGGFELRMRASIGISMGPKHGDSGEELMKAADAAMYRAKHGGRGRYEFFSAELTRQALERLTLENAMRDPRLYEQLVLQYQPQVSVASGRLVGAEALLRWQHPTRGLLEPHAFIPMAEEAGLIPSIGEWVLRTACAQAKGWLEMSYSPIRMAVNVSAYQIKAENMVHTVASALRETGLDPSLLELEVTEGAVQTSDGAPDILNRLKALGVRLALDDFGTGYSSLSSLKLLPFDRLKIDRSFVQDLQHDANGRALVRAIIAMGRSLNLDILAEGVETRAQLEFLREEGCDEMQGYLIGLPMSADELAMELRAQTADIASRSHALGMHGVE